MDNEKTYLTRHEILMSQRNERGVVVTKKPVIRMTFPFVDADGWTWTEVADGVEGRPPAGA